MSNLDVSPHREQSGVPVLKPGRYIGLEWNLPPVKAQPHTSVVLVYPDVYEIGMSHFGLHVLYSILANAPGVTVERAFSPWPDFEQYLRKNQSHLSTLESNTPLHGFDILFLTLPHELSYTNVLAIMDLGGIALLSEDRTDGDPIVIAGGLCTLNPKPMESFIDVFFIGEGEEGIREITDICHQTGGKRSSRIEKLTALATIPGCYVPRVHGTQTRYCAEPCIHKRIVQDLESAPHPSPPLVPICRPVHERIVVEAARGCPRQCRFCQARVYYSPFRQRKPETIYRLIGENIRQTGYEEVSLLSLNIADYPEIESLIQRIMLHLAPQNIALSLPSLRPEKLTESIIQSIRQVRKTGFTLAPEAGTDRLRKIIHKPYPTDRLLSGAAAVFQSGWSLIKLYFMIGQPYETDDDIEGIVELVRHIRQIGRRLRGPKAEIHISLSTFIPKPHTPFQWFGQIGTDSLHRRISYLRRALRIPGIKLSFHDTNSSRLEALLARGDERMGSVILDSYQGGCRFDAWAEFFKPEIWWKSCEKNGIDPEGNATAHLDLHAPLPWDFIHPGIDKSEILASSLAAQHLSETESKEPMAADRINPVITTSRPQFPQPKSADSNAACKFLGFYSVQEDYRFFGHMELCSSLIRAARRAQLPIVYSSGFNPHPRFSFASPPPIGFERYFEPLEFQLTEALDPADVLRSFNQQLPLACRFRMIIPLEKDGTIFNRLISATYGFRTEQPTDSLLEKMEGVTVLSPSTFFEALKNPEKTMIRAGYNFFIVIKHVGTDSPKTRDIAHLLVRREDMPRNRPWAARIFWNFDETGDNPLYMTDGN